MAEIEPRPPECISCALDHQTIFLVLMFCFFKAYSVMVLIRPGVGRRNGKNLVTEYKASVMPDELFLGKQMYSTVSIALCSVLQTWNLLR